MPESQDTQRVQERICFMLSRNGAKDGSGMRKVAWLTPVCTLVTCFYNFCTVGCAQLSCIQPYSLKALTQWWRQELEEQLQQLQRQVEEVKQLRAANLGWLCFDGASIPIVFWHAFFLYPFCIFLLFVLTRKHTTGTLSLYLDNTLLVLIPTYNFDNQSITYCSTYTTLPCM